MDKALGHPEPDGEYQKTATIRARQWFKMGDHPAVTQLAANGKGWIDTLEGGYIVTPGDWIATGVRGEHWPIKPDVFAATYKPVQPPTQPPASEDSRAELNRLAERVKELEGALEQIIDLFAYEWPMPLRAQSIARSALNQGVEK